MHNIIVTGGAGFIGSNLIKALLKKGCNVLSIDNYSTGTIENEARRSINSPAGQKLIYTTNDVSEIATYKFQADTVFHLGEYSRVEQSYEEPIKAMENITSTLPYVLDYCAKNNCKLIYSGSSTKFGNADSPYSLAKANNTVMVDKYCQMMDIDYAITYFYNVYGSNEISSGEYATVIGKYKKMVQDGYESLPVNGDGCQIRNFTHVDDIVSGLLLVGELGKGDGYQIGSIKRYTINELVALFGKKPDYQDSPKGNRFFSILDTSKISKLGWESKNSLEQYINSVTDGVSSGAIQNGKNRQTG